MLGLSKTTIRSDLSVLVLLGQLSAKPKVGYYIDQSNSNAALAFAKQIEKRKVGDVYSVPVIVYEAAMIQDAVVALYTEDVGTLIVTDRDNYLKGILSRKDLLKITLGHSDAPILPVSMAMTRYPNIHTVTPEDSVLDAARKMITHGLYCLPVVKEAGEREGPPQVMGRVTKTTMTRLLLEYAGGGEEIAWEDIK